MANTTKIGAHALRGAALTFTGDPFQAGIESTQRYESDAIVAMADGKITHFDPASEVRSKLVSGLLISRPGAIAGQLSASGAPVSCSRHSFGRLTRKPPPPASPEPLHCEGARHRIEAMNKSRRTSAGVTGFVAAFLMIAGCTGQPSRPTVPATAAPEDVAAAVAAVERFQAALLAGDFVAVAAELDPDVLILESGGAEYSAAEYLAAHAKSDAEFLKSARIKPGRRTARVSGDLAWVASTTEIEIEHEGEPVAIDGAETMILCRGPSGWKIVHIHWSSHARR